MSCVICGKKKAKRYCPAKNNNICPKCCGEKRGIEINCPLDCEYFIEGQKNHQQKITKQRIQKEGTKAYIKKAELYNKNPEIFAQIEILVAQTFRSNRKLKNDDFIKAFKQAHETLKTEKNGIYYSYAGENIYANQISETILSLIKDQMKKYSSNIIDLDFALDVLNEFLKDAKFYTENEDDDQSYLINIARYHPSRTDTPGKPDGLIIT